MHDGEPLALDQAGIHASARQRWLNVDHGKPPPAECLQQTESLFAENHEPFFNTIGHLRSFGVERNDRLCARRIAWGSIAGLSLPERAREREHVPCCPS